MPASSRRLEIGGERGETEVGDLGAPLAVDQDVAGLEIAMEDAALVRGAEPGAELARELERLVGGQPADAAQQRGEVLAVDVLHRQERLAVDLAEIVHAHDVADV